MYRVDTKAEHGMAGGRRSELSELGLVGWDESGLQVAGGEHPNELFFRATVEPGEYPMYIRIADDLLPRPVEVRKPLSVPVTSTWTDAISRRREYALKSAVSLQGQLRANKQIMVRFLGAAQWKEPGRNKSFYVDAHISPDLRELVGADVGDAMTEAFAEADRLWRHYNHKVNAVMREIRLGEQAARREARARGEPKPSSASRPGSPNVRLDLDDGMDYAVACTLHALIRLDAALAKVSEAPE